MKEDWKYEKIYSKQKQWKTILKKVSPNQDTLREELINQCLRENPLTAKDNKNNSSDSVSKLYNYGHGNTGKAFIQPLLDLNLKSILDVGCGFNEFCHDLVVNTPLGEVPRSDEDWRAHLNARMKSGEFNGEGLPEIDIFAVGVDCACPGADVIASAVELPFCDNSFEMISSFDCMEHIAEEEIEQVINELHRVSSKHIFLQIDLADHGTKIDGELLHVTLRERDWWNDMIEKKFKIEITHEFYTSKHPGDSNVNGKAACRVAHKSTENLHAVKGIKK